MAADLHISNGNGATAVWTEVLTDEARGGVAGETFKKGAKKKGKEKNKVITSEKEIANVLGGLLGKKKKEIKSKLKEKENVKKVTEENIKELVRKARTLESTTGALVRKYQETLKKNRSEVVNDYRKIITKIKRLDFIKKFEVDDKKRILFTTTPIKIKKQRWLRARTAGRYQIRIDFSAGDKDRGIQAINLDRVHGDCDHPNLSSTRFCWGDELEVDIENEYGEQDLYELVVDIYDLLCSANDEAGFTTWKYFFQHSTKRPKRYSFFKYDKENNVSSDVSPWISYSSTFGGASGAYYPSYLMTSVSLASPSTYASFPANNKGFILAELLRIGVVNSSVAMNYVERILILTGGATPNNISVRFGDGAGRDDEFVVFYSSNTGGQTHSTIPFPSGVLMPEGSERRSENWIRGEVEHAERAGWLRDSADPSASRTFEGGTVQEYPSQAVEDVLEQQRQQRQALDQQRIALEQQLGVTLNRQE